MHDIHRRFSDKFRSNWIKVKFYKEKPDLDNFKKLKDVRFCEATKEAITCPILLDRESISCLGAQYVFGWKPDFKRKLMGSCFNKRKTEMKNIKLMLSHTPCLNSYFNYIGLNTEGEPDLIMSYMTPRDAMTLVKTYHNHEGKSWDISLSGMVAICGGIAVQSFLTKNVSLSFGCDDSRKYADIRGENLAVGIPRKLFNIFVD